MKALPLIRLWSDKHLKRGRRPAWWAVLLLAQGLLVISGCRSNQGEVVISTPRAIDASQALVLPAPGGPSMVTVIESRYSNAIEQKVVLSTAASTAGENFLLVKMYGPMDRSLASPKSLSYRSIMASDIAREVRAALPGVSMATSALFLRNNYGPFGYAFGQSPSGDACIYGWQQLRADESERSNFRNTGAIQVRLRLCETAASEKQLLSVMYGYTLTGSFASEQWNPYGEPGAVDARIGADGHPVYPQDAELAQAKQIQPARNTVAVPKIKDVDPDAVQAEQERPESLVEVPAPAVSDDTTSTDGSPDSVNVIVPAPGCNNGTSACN